MKLADGINNAVGFAITAYGALALGTAVGAGVGLIALGTGGFSIVRCIKHGYKGKFNTHIKAACKLARTDEALTAFVRGLDDAHIQSTLDALDVGLRDVKPTPEDFAKWNLDPDKIAQELVLRLKAQHNLFKTDANASTLAHNILRAAFTAVSEQEAFWQQTELFVAKTVLERTSALMAGQVELKDDNVKTHAGIADIKQLLARYAPQAEQRGVTEAALRACIKKLGEERDLAADEMIPWLENFIEDAQKKRDEKVNEDAPFQAALEEAKKRFDAGQGDTASDALMQEFEREKQDEHRRKKERTRRRIHLLKEAIDYDELALKPEAAVQKWRLIAAELGITSEEDIGLFLFAQTNYYAEQSERRGSNSAALVAIAIYQEFLTIFPRDKAPMLWAEINISLGNVYKALGERSDDKMLHKATAAFENALKECTREKDPMHWAAAQNNLGNVYRVLGRWGDDKMLHKAIAAFENALKERTRDKVPLDWAATQNNLGNIYSVLGQWGDDKMLHKASAAYKDALKERTRNKAPMDWAMTQNNLSNVYRMLGERGDDKMLSKAIAASKNALKEHTREKAPIQWAMTQNNIGNVYRVLGKRGDDKMLHKAVTAHKNALKECTRKKAPMHWAGTQNNLGIVYLVLGERGDDKMLHKAVAAYKNALLENTRIKVPIQWAMTQNNLGIVYRVLGQRGDDEMLNKAVTAYKNALLEYTRKKAPMNWALTAENLGDVLWDMGDKQQAEQCLQDALVYFRSINAPYYTEKLENAMRSIGLEP